MGNLLIPDLEDDLAERLRQRAVAHGRSPEAEARFILDQALGTREDSGKTLGSLVSELFGPEHGFDLESYLPPREPMREPSSVDHDAA